MRGHVRKRGNKWAIVVYLGIDETTGKKQYKWFSGYEKKKDAELDMPSKLQEINNGTFVADTSTTVKEYFTSWLDDKKTQIRPGTLRTYTWLVNLHIIPNIGKYELTKLKPMHLQKLYTKMQNLDEPVSNRTILNTHRIIKQALDRAFKWGMVPRNIAELVDPPRPSNVEIQVWNAEEMATFLEAAQSSRYYMAFLLSISTGVRLGELLALRWEDVDLDVGVINIRRSYSYTGKGYKIEEPKTEKGKRAIALPPSTTVELRKHKTQQIKERLLVGELWQENGLVISTSVGTPVLQSYLRTLFPKLIKKAGVPKIRIHDLRHTHASMLLKQGVHPKVVQERLGHSDIQTTLNIYSHVLPGLQEAAAKQFDIFLNPDQKRHSK